ncbi:MAG: SGNH/GDSL hydrolase family protein [Candidatus Eutrophobiaceae bacterium]
MRRNLIKMIKLCREGDARILLVGMQMPANYDNATPRSFRKVYADLARSDVPFVPFLLKVSRSDKYFMEDNLHPKGECSAHSAGDGVGAFAADVVIGSGGARRGGRLLRGCASAV